MRLKQLLSSLEAQHITPKRGCLSNMAKSRRTSRRVAIFVKLNTVYAALAAAPVAGAGMTALVAANQALSPFQLNTSSDQTSGKNDDDQDACYSQVSFALTHDRVKTESPEPYNDEQHDAYSNP